MVCPITLRTTDETQIIATKVLSASAIGFLACKYITTIDPTTGALFAALAMVIDALATKFIKADKTNKALISAALSFFGAHTLTGYFVKLTTIQAVKITFYTTTAQLILATLGAGILMGSFASLASIATNKFIAKF